MTVYESLVRPLLFLLPPEPAHKLGRRALAGKQPWQAMSGRFQVRDSRLETEVAGLRLRSPIGLSAGFDKDVETLPGVSRLGFGVVTVGTIMPKPRAGNPGPRLLRRTRERGLVNSLGLPSKGLEYAVANLSRRRESHPAGGPVVIANIGGFSVEEILTSHRAVEPWVDAVEIDWICPNQKERPDLNEMDHTARLLEAVSAERRKPLFLKLPLRVSEENWRRALAMADIAARCGLEGVSMGGGIMHENPRLAVGRGNLTGRPVFDNTLRIVRDLRSRIDERLVIKTAGGVFDGEGAFRLLEAGAGIVDILTSFVYLGPSAPARISRGLLRKMDEEGIGSVRELRSRSSAPLAHSSQQGANLVHDSL